MVLNNFYAMLSRKAAVLWFAALAVPQTDTGRFIICIKDRELKLLKELGKFIL